MSQRPSYTFKPHERPFMPGSPASPDQPGRRRLAYALIGLLLGVTGGLQNGLLLANLPQIQGALGLSVTEGGWIMAAYYMTTACMSMLMFKVRRQFGIERFLRGGIAALVVANGLQLLHNSYGIELASRALSGVVGNVMVTLSMFYLMQAVPARARVAGLLLGTGLSQLALPLARTLSPWLLADGDVSRLFVFQFSLSLLCWGSTSWLHLPEGDTVDSFEWTDLWSFGLFAGGMALACAFLVQGRLLNWTGDWLGYALAGAILMIGASLLIERERQNPMLHLEWMSSRVMLKFVATGALLRILLSEQTVGAAGLLSVLGMGNDQLVTFYGLLTATTLLGLLMSVARLDPTDLRRPVLVSLALIAVCAFVDASASNLTRPANFYLSQAAMAFAAIYFMGPFMTEGLLRALVKGPTHIISFSALFGLSQTVGGLLGAGLLSWFQTLRAKEHLMALGARASAADPLVAQRIQQLGGALASSVSDPSLRGARASASFVQQITREANVLAFNDVFFWLGVAASACLLAYGAVWLRDRRRGHVPLARELAAIQAIRERGTAS